MVACAKTQPGVSGQARRAGARAAARWTGPAHAKSLWRVTPPDTVYATFGSKARLLTALLDIRLAPGGQTGILDRPEMQAIRGERDPRQLLRLFARDYAAMSERVRPVAEVLRTAKAAEPQMAAVREEMEVHRFE